MVYVCSSADISPFLILLMLIGVVILDCVALYRNGWLFALMGTLLAFISGTRWSGGNQNIVTFQTFQSGTWYCNIVPAYPLLIIVFGLLAVMSVLVMYVTSRTH